MKVEELIPLYIRYEQTKDDSLFDAVEWFDAWAHSEPEKAWATILGVLRQTDDPNVLNILAAGPLEDLIAYNGTLWIEQIESEAKMNPKFKTLLGGVWQNTTPDYVWQRVLAARI